MTKEMKVPMLGGLPYKWPHGKNDFPYPLDCGIQFGAGFACMSTISKNVWVPVGWKEKVRSEWESLRLALSCTPHWKKADGTEHDHLKNGEKIDYWSVRRLLRQRLESHVKAIARHNEQAAWRYGEIGSRRKKPNLEKVTPLEWVELRDCFNTFSIPPEAWTRDMEREKWEELFNFLIDGAVPDGVQVDEKNLPKLSISQAGVVLWFLNEVLGVDWHDLRCQPCSRCGGFCDTDQMTSCEHCGIHICHDCMDYDVGFCEEHDACSPCCKGQPHEEDQ